MGHAQAVLLAGCAGTKLLLVPSLESIWMGAHAQL